MKRQQIVLVSRPQGLPTLGNFRTETTEIPSPRAGQAVVESLYVSVDPYMRGRMNEGKSYVPPYPVGGVIKGGVVGRVIESASPNLAVGDIVLGGYGWQTHDVVEDHSVRKIDPTLAPISAYLGVLGMTGLTAYFGLLDIGKPQPGETVVISGAAGAVGTVVGQIANIKGARSVGIAGSKEKCEYLVKELGFTAAINYKDTDFAQQLSDACPHGVDVYFDNVGGEVSDAVMKLINKFARISICGQIADYNRGVPAVGPRVQGQLLIHSALMQGFIVGNYAERFGEGVQALSAWLAEGKIKHRETIMDGFEHVVDAFLELFSGGNTGKLLVKVADIVR